MGQVTSFELTEKLYAKVNEMARDMGLKKSDIYRMALMQWIKNVNIEKEAEDMATDYESAISELERTMQKQREAYEIELKVQDARLKNIEQMQNELLKKMMVDKK